MALFTIRMPWTCGFPDLIRVSLKKHGGIRGKVSLARIALLQYNHYKRASERRKGSENSVSPSQRGWTAPASRGGVRSGADSSRDILRQHSEFLPIFQKHSGNEDGLRDRSLARSCGLEALTRRFRGAVQIQTVVPVGSPDQRQAVRFMPMPSA